MIELPRIAARVLGQPLLLHPMKAELILSIIGERIGVASYIDLSNIPDELKALRSDKPASNRLTGEPVMLGRQLAYSRHDGVGVIPVVGTLVNRGAHLGEDSSGFTSYEGLMAQLAMAVEDTRVGHILLDIDSPGGEAGGMFALAQAIRTAGMRKPVTALANDMAASAAYGIASAASTIVVSPTSTVGHIGVFLMHMDQSKEMEMKGRKPTLIYSGKHKVDGHPFGPLSAQVTADLQKHVDQIYEQFLGTVAAGRRDKLTVDAARATEARTYVGAEAEAAGLADRVDTFASTISRLSAAMRARQHHVGAISMDNLQPVTRAEHDAAVAAARIEGRTAGQIDGAAAGFEEGADAAIARVKTILALPEAKERGAQALVFALDTNMNSEQVGKILATMPVMPSAPAPAATATPPLAERGAPPVPTGAAENSKPDPNAFWSGIVAEVNKDVAAKRAELRR